MNINKIISEEINNYIMESIISEEIDNFINEDLMGEKKKSRINQDISDVMTGKKEINKGKIKNKNLKNKKKKNTDIAKNGKKLRNGLRTDFDRKKDRETNPNLTNQDAEDINDIIDSDAINTAAVAKQLYPGHTDEGAQSQLRKKVKGLENDNGSKYKLKKKEAHKLRRIIARMLHT